MVSGLRCRAELGSLAEEAERGQERRKLMFGALARRLFGAGVAAAAPAKSTARSGGLYRFGQSRRTRASMGLAKRRCRRGRARRTDLRAARLARREAALAHEIKAAA